MARSHPALLYSLYLFAWPFMLGWRIAYGPGSGCKSVIGILLWGLGAVYALLGAVTLRSFGPESVSQTRLFFGALASFIVALVPLYQYLSGRHSPLTVTAVFAAVPAATWAWLRLTV